MACVTLKRLHEADALSPPHAVKRRRRALFDSNVGECAIKEPKPNPFPECSTNNLEQNILSEIQRLHKLKQLTNEGTDMLPDSQTPRSADKALFSYKQVQLICQRMLQDQENKLREEYQSVLQCKLAEQYDAFVKFTFDQIQRRYEATPSYLS